MRNAQNFYRGQSPTDCSPEFGESHVSAKEISKEFHNPVRKPAMGSSEINSCEPDIHTHCTDELNSNVEGSHVLDIDMYFRDLRTKYPRNLILAHLNVNSIRYKFYEISNILNGNCIHIFGISETKIDASFTSAQFRIPDFKMYRQDRDSKGNGGGLIVYIKDSIPHRQLNKYTGITSSIEHICLLKYLLIRVNGF